MDYLALPPEINSTRIESGPGSIPLLQSAQAWTILANGLAEVKSQHANLTADTAAVWAGAGASAFRRASVVFETWLTTMELTASTAAAATMQAVSAYETTRVAMVPLVAVVGNRTQLAMLVATNVLGQNTPAIMATESIYAEMWAQDVAAMSGYQAESAAATAQLQPANPAPATTTGMAPQGITQAVTTTSLPAASGGWLTTPNSFLAALNDPSTPVGFLETQFVALQSSGLYQIATYPLIFGMMGGANQMMGRSNEIADEGNHISYEMEQDDKANMKMTPTVGEMPDNDRQFMGRPINKAGWLSVPPNWDKATQQVTLASKATPLTTPGTTPGMMPMPIAAVSAPDRKQRKGDDVLKVKLILPKFT